jgi:hypothetical protein
MDFGCADLAVAASKVRRGDLGHAVVLLRRAQRQLADAEIELLERIRKTAIELASRRRSA